MTLIEKERSKKSKIVIIKNAIVCISINRLFLKEEKIGSGKVSNSYLSSEIMKERVWKSRFFYLSVCFLERYIRSG